MSNIVDRYRTAHENCDGHITFEKTGSGETVIFSDCAVKSKELHVQDLDAIDQALSAALKPMDPKAEDKPLYVEEKAFGMGLTLRVISADCIRLYVTTTEFFELSPATIPSLVDALVEARRRQDAGRFDKGTGWTTFKAGADKGIQEY